MGRVYNAAEEWTRLVNKEVLSITPLDTGALRESNYVVRKASVNGIEIEVGFKTNYAPVVHEWPADTNWTTPGTTNKYLQKPFYGKARTLPTYIRSQVKV